MNTRYNAIRTDAQAAKAEEAQEHQDELAGMLDFYKHHGGNPDDLLIAVQKLINAQAKIQLAAGQYKATQ